MLQCCVWLSQYICGILPSMTVSWLFSRPWSGFGGSGGGGAVFICLMSDSSTAPADVRWQEKKKNRETWERSNLLTAEVRILRWRVRKYLTARALNLLMHTLFWRSWLCIPLSLTFTGICLSISGLRNGGWTWITVFLQGLAVYLVAHDKQGVRASELYGFLKGWRLNWRDDSYFGEMGLQTRYSRLLQQPRVNGFTPPWNFPVTCGIMKSTPVLFTISDVLLLLSLKDLLYWCTWQHFLLLTVVKYVENQTDLFIGGASSGHQVQVESSETQDRDKKQPRYTDHYQTVHTVKENWFVLVSIRQWLNTFTQINAQIDARTHILRIRDSAVQLPYFVHVVQDVYEAKGEDADHMTCQWQQKQKEVAVVSPPDAVVHPGTVMVKVLRGDCGKRKI